MAAAPMTVPQALQLLQLEPGATRKQIRAAYKRLALQLHPDKQHTTLAQQQRQQSPASSADATSAFARLSAAYSLLLRDSRPHSCQQGSQDHVLPPFEAAYATGSLFSEQLIDEAVLLMTPPADIVHLQQLAAAAAVEGQLAQHLAANPPTAADEQLWRQLYTRLELRQQARRQRLPAGQQQQQKEGGVGLGELLSDLLLKPTGPLYVDESGSESESDDEHSSEEGARATVYLQQHSSSQQQQQQQQQQHPQLLPPTGGHSSKQQAAQQAPQQQQRQVQAAKQQQLQLLPQAPSQQPVPQKPPKQQRHGWGFYWLWLRRALLAKAVVSVLSSSLRAKMYEHRFPEPPAVANGPVKDCVSAALMLLSVVGCTGFSG